MKNKQLVVISAKVTSDLKRRILKSAKQSDSTLSEFVAGILFQAAVEETVAKQHDNLRRDVGVK